MKQATEIRIFSAIFVFIPAVLAGLGCVGLLALSFFFHQGALPLVSGVVSEMVNVPFDTVSAGFTEFKLETQNYLLFQLFDSLPPLNFPVESQLIGLGIWLLFTFGVMLASGFQRYPFIGSMAVAIFILVISGVNDLNIGLLGQNSGLLISFLGLLLPAIVIHTFFPYSSLKNRSMIILAGSILAWSTLIYLSPVPAPTLLLAESTGLSAMILSALFITYIGHAVISTLFVFLSKLNQGVGLKITWHFTLLSIAYLVFVGILFLQATGELRPSFPLPPVFLVFILTGILGYLETQRKIQLLPQPYTLPFIGKGIYMVGFAITSLLWFKAELTINRPMSDFLTHTFLYSQIGFGLLFFLYLIANFLGIMNSGNAVEKIMYRPPFFPYYHMRLGALLSSLVLAIFADGVLLVQFHSASANLSADYYQALGRNREASILYEHAFDRYRKNPKNLNAIAHYYFSERQPTPGIQVLLRSFDERPNVPDIILLASKLQGTSKNTDALFYLEEGLKYFPGNPFLLNNLAFLKHKQRLAKEALVLWQQMDEKTATRDANLQALYAIHDVDWQDADLGNNLIGQVNRMANYNLAGQTAPFVLSTDSIRFPSLINRAILRNQWSQAAPTEYRDDIRQMEAIEEMEMTPSVAAEWLETKVVRNHGEGQVDGALNNLGFLANNYPGSAGFFLSMQAKIFASQSDFTRSAEAFVQAERQGFSNITSDILAIIWLGGKSNEAAELAKKYDLDMPTWINPDNESSGESDERLLFAAGLANLLPGTMESAWKIFPLLQNPEWKAYYSLELLLRKSHWFGAQEFDAIGKVLKTAYPEHGTQIDALISYFKDGAPFTGYGSLDWLPLRSADPTANSYFTPLVLRQALASENPIDAYNLLHTASRFNRDPLLWIELVNYSRKIGQDSYASSYLREMGNWIDAEELIELQIKYLR